MSILNLNERLQSQLFGAIDGTEFNGFMDIDNQEFTRYFAIESNYRDLVEFVNTLNIDRTYSEDLVHDCFASYSANESNNNCYDGNAGKGIHITVEEAIKSRLKRMAKNGKYYNKTDGDFVVTAHFTDDTTDDSVQTHYTNMASCEDINRDLVEEKESTQEQIFYFINCTKDCRVSGRVLLEKLDDIQKYIEDGIFDSSVMGDIWIINGMREVFASIFRVYNSDRTFFLSALDRAKGEMELCSMF